MKIKDLPKFEKHDDLIDWMAKNSDDIIYEAKANIKNADSIPFVDMSRSLPHKTSKDISTGDTAGVLKRRLIINTTNIFDSHNDVHIKGIWTKSIKENKRIKLKQEHGSRFKDVIADKSDLEVSTKRYKLKELGFNSDIETEALVFDATIRESRNKEMYNEYKDGNIDNHSVGMQYGKILYAVNSDKDEHLQYKINWDKYYPEIANKSDVDKVGYFWAVLEAKLREGSAVPDGSNPITPTLESRKAHSDDEENEQAAKDALAKNELKQFINNL